jgi:hypothetical protein
MTDEFSDSSHGSRTPPGLPSLSGGLRLAFDPPATISHASGVKTPPKDVESSASVFFQIPRHPCHARILVSSQIQSTHLNS